VFATAFFTHRSAKTPISAATWCGVSVNAVIPGAVIGQAIANIPVESLGIGGWTRSLALVAVALAAPVAATAALVQGLAPPAFARLLDRQWPSNPLTVTLGAILLVVMWLSVQTGLGLVFDPRYRDFPYAPLTSATVPFLVLTIMGRRQKGPRGTAEVVAAAALAVAAVFVALNETFANWQAIWLAAILAVMAFILIQSRDVQSS
jgi:glucan 1,3-beta-glucosidase